MKNIYDVFIYIVLCVCVCVYARALSCVILCDPINCSLPGSLVHGILQIILECVAVSSPRGSSQPRDGTQVSCISCTGRRFFTISVTWETHFIYTDIIV